MVFHEYSRFKHHSDEDLLRLSIGSSVSAFETLMARHKDQLIRVVQRVGATLYEAEEAFIISVMKIWDNLPNFNSTLSKFTTWICQIAKNTAIDYYRSSRKHQMDGLRAKNVFENQNLSLSPYHVMCAKDTQNFIDRKMKNCSLDTQAILILHMNQMRYREIAELLGMPIGTVQAKLHRLRNHLATALGVTPLHKRGFLYGKLA